MAELSDWITAQWLLFWFLIFWRSKNTFKSWMAGWRDEMRWSESLMGGLVPLRQWKMAVQRSGSLILGFQTNEDTKQRTAAWWGLWNQYAIKRVFARLCPSVAAGWPDADWHCCRLREERLSSCGEDACCSLCLCCEGNLRTKKIQPFPPLGNLWIWTLQKKKNTFQWLSWEIFHILNLRESRTTCRFLLLWCNSWTKQVNSLL